MNMPVTINPIIEAASSVNDIRAITAGLLFSFLFLLLSIPIINIAKTIATGSPKINVSKAHIQSDDIHLFPALLPTAIVSNMICAMYAKISIRDTINTMEETLYSPSIFTASIMKKVNIRKNICISSKFFLLNDKSRY